MKIADRAAKDALSKAQPENFDLPCTDVFVKFQPFVSSFWQERWDEEVDNKLYTIVPQIDEKYYLGCTNRKDEVIINRPSNRSYTFNTFIQNGKYTSSPIM